MRNRPYKYLGMGYTAGKACHALMALPRAKPMKTRHGPAAKTLKATLRDEDKQYREEIWEAMQAQGELPSKVQKDHVKRRARLLKLKR